MKGLNHIGVKVTGHIPAMSTHIRVPSAKNIHAQGMPASSTKISHAGGFMASRKKGFVLGSHVA